jgi:GGDEF domain-containing protein
MNTSIKKLLKKIKELEFLAYFDELTKVYNRRGFFKEAEKIFKAVVYKRKEIEILELLSRLILGFYFIFNGFNHFRNLNSLANLGSK